ncbi:MAG: preprotein translocase subunit SecG [Microgenomates group bacterium]
MKNLITAVQIISSLALIVLILVQARGTGLGRGSASSGSFTRRGLEKLLFRLTFIFAGLFLIFSLIQLF